MEDFYEIIEHQIVNGKFEYTVRINAEHRVFAGHFPGRPVVPGVMTMMMIRECVEDAMHLKSTHYASIGECKYLQPIIPDGRNLKIIFATDGKSVNAEIESADGVKLLKIKAILA